MHIVNTCSGEVKDKLNELYGVTLSQKDRDDLATLTYYPAAKFALIMDSGKNKDQWYRQNIHRLVLLYRWISVKYTRNKVRASMP